MTNGSWDGPTTGPLASPGYWLHHAALAWRSELGRRLTATGLTPTQFDVLAALSRVSKAHAEPRQQDVADFAGIDRMMTSKVVAVLEGRGLLVRIEDPQDARVRRLSLTDEGKSVVRTATAIARTLDQDFFGQGSVGDRLATARELLRSLVLDARES